MLSKQQFTSIRIFQLWTIKIILLLLIAIFLFQTSIIGALKTITVPSGGDIQVTEDNIFYLENLGGYDPNRTNYNSIAHIQAQTIFNNTPSTITIHYTLVGGGDNRTATGADGNTIPYKVYQGTSINASRILSETPLDNNRNIRFTNVFANNVHTSQSITFFAQSNVTNLMSNQYYTDTLIFYVYKKESDGTFTLLGTRTDTIHFTVQPKLSIRVNDATVGNTTLNFGELFDNAIIPFKLTLQSNSAAGFNLKVRSENASKLRNTIPSLRANTNVSQNPPIVYQLRLNNVLISIPNENTDVNINSTGFNSNTEFEVFGKVTIRPLKANNSNQNPNLLMPAAGTYTDTLTFTIEEN